MTSKERVKNSCSVEAMSKIIRGNIRTLEIGKLCLPDLDDVCSHFESFMVAAAEASGRPTEKLLKEACRDAFQNCTAGEDLMFAQRLSVAFQHARVKYNKATTGAKLNNAVHKIGRALASQTLSQTLELGAFARRDLKRRRSSPEHFLPPSSQSSNSLSASVIVSPEAKEKMAALAERIHTGTRKLSDAPPVEERATISLPERKCEPGQKALEPNIPLSRAQVFALMGVSLDVHPMAETTFKEEAEVWAIGSSDSEDDVACQLTFAAGKASSSLEDFGGSTSSSSKGPTVVAQYVDSACICVVRRLSDGNLLKADMKVGPGGFLLAAFPGEEAVETEIPNLLLEKPVSAKKVKAVLKKPAARVADVEESIAASGSDSEEADGVKADNAEELQPAKSKKSVPMRYHAEFYKSCHKIAIRENFMSKSNVLRFGGNDYKHLSKAVMKELGELLCEKIHAGMNFEDAKSWVNAELQAKPK